MINSLTSKSDYPGPVSLDDENRFQLNRKLVRTEGELRANIGMHISSSINFLLYE